MSAARPERPRTAVAGLNYALAALFGISGLVSGLALIGTVAAAAGLTATPALLALGRFLTEAFLWAAPLIPLLLFAFSYLSVAPRVSDLAVVALAPAGLVVLTLGTFAQLATSAEGTLVTALLTSTFGYLQSQILLLLALALEVLVTIAVVQRASGGTVRGAAALLTDGSEIDELPEVGEYAPVRAEPQAAVADGIATADPVEASGAPAATDAPAAGIAATPQVDEEQPDAPPRAQVVASVVALPSVSLPRLPEPAQQRSTAAAAEPPVEQLLVDEARADVDVDLDPEAGDAEERRRAAIAARRKRSYRVPVEGVLDDYESGHYWKIDQETEEAAAVLMATLAEFKIEADVTGIRRGPVITMFEILPAPGVKISRIVNLADNIALRLAASRVRIVAPIPGKHAVGIEVPNRSRAIVSFKEMVSLPEFTDGKAAVPVALGKDITGEGKIIDLTATPHLLIAGATGSGKSVCVNSLICSILYSRTPSEVRLMLIDPKIVELKFYNDVPHLLTPVITEPRRAFQALQYCLCEMERRYSLLDAFGVRDIRSYNAKVTAEVAGAGRANALPYLVIVIDEFADLMASTGKELESTLARLAAMSRAVGIHLVLATQRPSIEVITGLIKANIPSRIAFMVAGKFDSRIIIDTVGAEKLLGKGDMLFAPAWDSNPQRIQGAFLSEHEVERVVDHVRTLGAPNYVDEELLFDDEAETTMTFGDTDALMEQALEIVVAAGKASASYLQRKLKIGYNRAARLVEEMEDRGIVGAPNGSKPRELLHIPTREPATAAEHP